MNFKVDDYAEEHDQCHTEDCDHDHQRAEGCCDMFQEYLFIIWDDAKFFRMDTDKLDRLTSGRVTWCSRFMSLEWVLTMLIIVAIAIYVIVTASARIGTMKHQTVNFQSYQEFDYDVAEAMPLVHATWLYVDEILPKMKQYQNETRNDTGALKMKNGADKNLSNSFAEFDYFDWEFTEAFLCQRIQVVAVK